MRGCCDTRREGTTSSTSESYYSYQATKSPEQARAVEAVHASSGIEVALRGKEPSSGLVIGDGQERPLAPSVWQEHKRSCSLAAEEILGHSNWEKELRGDRGMMRTRTRTSIMCMQKTTTVE